MALPNDPIMLLSMINLKLRDFYPTLDALCEDLDEDKAALAAQGKALTIRVKEGDTIVRVDPRYFRPTEVETLLGDPAKAQAKLGWAPRTTFEEMVQEMARHDLELALRDAVVEDAGFTSFKHEE